MASAAQGSHRSTAAGKADPAGWPPRQPGLRDMQVDRRGLEAGMSQQNLDRAQIHAGIQQVRGVTVPQRVRRNAFADPRSPGLRGPPCGR